MYNINLFELVTMNPQYNEHILIMIIIIIITITIKEHPQQSVFLSQIQGQAQGLMSYNRSVCFYIGSSRSHFLGVWLLWC
jgi:hypothetical protein